MKPLSSRMRACHIQSNTCPPRPVHPLRPAPVRRRRAPLPGCRAGPACTRNTSGCDWHRPRKQPWPQSHCGPCRAVADDGQGLGIQQGGAGGPQGPDSGPQPTSPAIEPALAGGRGKRGPVVGPHEAREPGLPRKGLEIHGRQERDDFAVAEAGLGPGLDASRPRGPGTNRPPGHGSLWPNPRMPCCALWGTPGMWVLNAFILRGFPFLGHPNSTSGVQCQIARRFPS